MCPSSSENSSSGCSSSLGQHSQVSLSSSNRLFPEHHSSTTRSNSPSASSDSSCLTSGCCSFACKHNSSSSLCSHHSFVADCSHASSSYSTSSSEGKSSGVSLSFSNRQCSCALSSSNDHNPSASHGHLTLFNQSCLLLGTGIASLFATKHPAPDTISFGLGLSLSDSVGISSSGDLSSCIGF